MNFRRTHSFGTALAALVFLAVGSTLSIAGPAQTTASGRALFDKRCGGCHALDRDKEGPRLRGVYGRLAGSVDSFPYSDALKKSHIRWTDETLDKWLANTEKLVADNDMAFHVDRQDERAGIVSYLKQTSGK